MTRSLICGLVAAVGAVALACSPNGATTPIRSGQGRLAVKLVDAPVPFDSIKEVNVFVVRVDARRARPQTDSELGEDADEGHDGMLGWAWGHADSTKWVTIVEPNKAFNMLTLQGGVNAFLGDTPADTGAFKAIRLVIDPAQSTIVLKDGTVLSATSDPPVEFESPGRRALFVEFDDSVEVKEGTTSTITLDIRLAESVTLRGRTVRDGFFFRPVVTGHFEGGHD